MSKPTWEKDVPWLTQLRRITLECNKAGWDSYGAAPVTNAAIHLAYVLLRDITRTNDPWDVPYPFPRNDGGITLEWNDGRPDCLQIDPDGKTVHWERDDDGPTLVLAR